MLKTLATCLFFVFIICMVSRYALNYEIGYSELSDLPLFWSFILYIVKAITIIMIVLTVVISVIRRQYLFWMCCISIVLFSLIGLEVALPSSNSMIALGMRDRLVHDRLADELRSFAEDFHQLPVPDPGLPGTGKTLMRNELIGTSLKAKYPFLSWIKGARHDGPSYISESDNIVDVRWGGALLGHWGFSISLNGKPIFDSKEVDVKSFRVSNDIIVVSESD